jgi:hypothetical protein
VNTLKVRGSDDRRTDADDFGIVVAEATRTTVKVVRRTVLHDSWSMRNSRAFAQAVATAIIITDFTRSQTLLLLA